MCKFLACLAFHGCRDARDYDQLDVQLSFWVDYASEEEEEEGFGKSLTADMLSAAQHFLRTRKRFPSASSALATWPSSPSAPGLAACAVPPGP